MCVVVGMLAHLAGDMCTHHGCPLLYPLSRHDFGLLPQRMRITTNKLAEHWIVTPLLLVALAWFAWRNTGPAVAAHIRVAGRLSQTVISEILLLPHPDEDGPAPDGRQVRGEQALDEHGGGGVGLGYAGRGQAEDHASFDHAHPPG